MPSARRNGTCSLQFRVNAINSAALLFAINGSYTTALHNWSKVTRRRPPREEALMEKTACARRILAALALAAAFGAAASAASPPIVTAHPDIAIVNTPDATGAFVATASGSP